MVFIYLKDKEHNTQINQLIKAIVAKNAQDYSNMTLSEKTRVEMENKPPLGPTSDEYVPLGTADPATFDRMIEDINSQVAPLPEEEPKP